MKGTLINSLLGSTQNLLAFSKVSGVMALILTSTTKKIFKLHPRQYGFKLTFFGVNHAANI